MESPSPDDDPADHALRAFTAELEALRIAAGKPTNEQLAENSRLSAGTISNVFNSRHLSKWQTIKQIVAALDGDEDEWRARWTACRTARDSYQRVPAPAPAPGTDNASSAKAPPTLSGSLGDAQHPGRQQPRTSLIVSAIVLAITVAGVALALRGSNDPDRSHSRSRSGDESTNELTNSDVAQPRPETSSVRGERLVLAGATTWRDEIHVDLDTMSVQLNQSIPGDDFFYRHDDRNGSPRPMLTRRTTTSIASVGDNAPSLRACREAFSTTPPTDRIEVHEGEHLCISTDSGAVSSIYVDKIERNGQVELKVARLHT